jgi:hypothetical protein
MQKNEFIEAIKKGDLILTNAFLKDYKFTPDVQKVSLNAGKKSTYLCVSDTEWYDDGMVR